MQCKFAQIGGRVRNLDGLYIGMYCMPNMHWVAPMWREVTSAAMR